MPSELSYPGVYVEELPSGVRAITGVATSITAFIGRAWRGPVDEPVMLFSFADYDRAFGGMWRESSLSYAVQQFFANGGSRAVVVRVATREGATAAASALITGFPNDLVFRAASPGSWGMNLKVSTDDTNTKDPADTSLFHLTVVDDPETKDDALGKGGSGASEKFLNVSVDPASPRFVRKVLEAQSKLLRVEDDSTDEDTAPGVLTGTVTPDSGTDGDDIGEDEVVDAANAATRTGMYALEKTDLFNLLCIPPYVSDADNGSATWAEAAKYCKDRRAFLIVDAPAEWDVAAAVAGVSTFIQDVRSHGALYFPRLRMPDPLQEGRLEDFAPCGVVAGGYARTDTERGIWKAPAGTDAALAGTLGLSIGGVPGNLVDGEVGQLNPLGINSLRGMPVIGHVVWGARTLEGADALASQWKYVPVRRLALFIEESLFRGTQWVVFEPNDEPLWAQIRLNVGAFMTTLFRQGAFQGQTPRDAYFVKCSRETTTQTDIDNGIVNIVVGFAPLKPAEFVVLKIQQISPQQ